MTEPAKHSLVGGQFTVQFCAGAQGQVGSLEWSDYEAIRLALHDCAGSQGWVETGTFEPQVLAAQPSLDVRGYRVAFEVDDALRMLRVTSVTRARP